MSDGSANHGDPKQGLSALVDGEVDPAQVQRLCGAWRDDAELRSTWHAYQLIGDVMRSDDLASDGRRDEAFLTALRARLADEPVVLAPQVPAVAPARALQRRTWAAPLAVAAGFVAVAGVLVVTRVSMPVGGASSMLAAAPRSPSPAAQPVVAASSADAAANVAVVLGPDQKLVRDVRLDRYLAAHKQFDRGAAVSVPGVMLRNAATYAPER